ncbi:MAG: alpha-L-fucosidase [Lacipirellulaceae bacterium]
MHAPRIDRLAGSALIARVAVVVVGITAASRGAPPAPIDPTPSPRQLAWHGLEFYGFVHFTVNTFTDREWGNGDEDPAVFQPTALDADQWAQVAQQAGMKGLIFTAKHHDGFCLWPSAFTEHSVKSSPWREGRGDVVRELADACRRHGLKFGVYLSPWDRNHAEYGRPAYVAYYKNQLRELLTGYGDLFEVWHDGANGGTGYYGGANEERKIDATTYYDFPGIWALTRELQPQAVIFSDAGPDIRWLGNERGIAPDPCWGAIHPKGMHPGVADASRLERGDFDGTVWRPAEADVSLRKGWFFHPEEEPKSLAQLMDIYYASVGRGCCLLLNLSPDREGRLCDADVARMAELGEALRREFAVDLARGAAVEATSSREAAPDLAPGNVVDGDRSTYWAAEGGVRSAALTLRLGAPQRVNRVRVQEHLPLGQRVKGFVVEARNVAGVSPSSEAWVPLAHGEAIGARSVLRFDAVTTDALRLRVLDAKESPTIATFEAYLAAP